MTILVIVLRGDRVLMVEFSNKYLRRLVCLKMDVK